jgi:hypothetical protein
VALRTSAITAAAPRIILGLLMLPLPSRVDYRTQARQISQISQPVTGQSDTDSA